jgi:hypothetical protein
MYLFQFCIKSGGSDVHCIYEEIFMLPEMPASN